MRFSRILLFVFFVLLGLTLISVFMPEGGIKVGNVVLEFPTLSEIFSTTDASADEEPALTPEQLMEQRMADMQSEKVDEFRSFAESNPARIYLPGGDDTYLDPLFDALLNASDEQVRIVHYGDSQLECDRISGDLRERFQTEFGGSGVGVVPAFQTVATYSLSQTISPDCGHYLAFGSGEFRASHSRYGMMAQVNRVYSGTTISIRPRDLEKYPHAAPMKRVVVMANGSGGITLKSDTISISLTAEEVNDSYTNYVAEIPQGVKNLRISFAGAYDVYGIMLDGENGVAVDNIPMRGCSGTIFTRIEKNSIKGFYDTQNVKLIILQYGGNSVPSVKSPKAISEYMTSLRKQIRLFHELAPKASILFIGPADMATKKGGVMQTYPNLPEVVDSLKSMALEEGAAFWDMFAAMGGKGTIIQWYKASPSLACGDYIHFTPKGAQKISDMLYDTMMFYYRFYRMRTGKETEALKQELDSIDKDNMMKFSENIGEAKNTQ